MAEDDFTLQVERHIAAPVATVWHAMTERLEAWFCPRPWQARIRTLDWRAGGRSVLVMHGPAGEEMVNEGVVLEFIPETRFVFTDAFRAGWHPAGPFMVGVFEVTEAGDGTLYRASARHWTREAMEQHRAMGFEAGWGAAAEQLRALVEGRG